MTRHYLAALFCAAALAFATKASAFLVSPLPASTPQQAEVGQVFPNPIGVVVTDDNGRGVAGARVRWFVPRTSTLRMEPRPTAGCFVDLGTDSCETLTDAAGVARLPAFSQSAPGAQELTVIVTVDNYPEGNAYFQFAAGAHQAPARLEPVSGIDQAAVVGTRLSKPFRVRLTRADGSSIANQSIRFAVPGYSSQPRVAFRAGQDGGLWSAVTDADGYAETGLLNVGWGMGIGIVNAEWTDLASQTYVRTSFQYRVTNAQGGNTISLQDMWWNGPKENGWGVAIAQHKEQLFAIVFAYDPNGKPTWYSISAGRWFGGIGNQFGGGFTSPKGTPFFAYDASKLGGLYETGRSGSATFYFQGENAGQLDMFMALRGFDKNIERFDFSTEGTSPIRGVGDLWWGGPSQNGWGVSIMEQQGGLFSVWFTYGEDGEPTWFAMTAGEWTSSNTFEGRMHRTESSGWFGVPYDATKFRAIDVGPYKLRFLGPNSALLEYNVDGRTGTLTLSRVPFGDVD